MSSSATLAPAGVLGNYNITSNTALFTIGKKAASVTPNAAVAVRIRSDAKANTAVTNPSSPAARSLSIRATLSRPSEPGTRSQKLGKNVTIDGGPLKRC